MDTVTGRIISPNGLALPAKNIPQLPGDKVKPIEESEARL
jgi:hypothetical protein